MPILHAIVLGIVQGLSEFLPISSSGHLILVPDLLGWHDLSASLNKTFDVALHLGTFVGAVAYFRHDLVKYLAAALQSIRQRAIRTIDERIAWLLLLSAAPGAVLGAAFEKFIEDHLGKPVIIGVMLIVFGLVMYAADRLPQSRVFDRFQTRDAVLMGVAQAVSLQPGVSRSGVTISMGRWLGFDRDAAARLSFLMSLPIIAGAALYKGTKLATGGGIPPGMAAPFAWGIVSSGITGFVAIAFLLKLLRTHSLTPFVIYRVVVGVVVIIVFATGLR